LSVRVTAIELVLMERAAAASVFRLDARSRGCRARARRSASRLWAPVLFRELSGGQQQRVRLAKALVNDPKCWFSTSHGRHGRGQRGCHDRVSAREESRQGATIVIVTHHLPSS
jgi:predicted ABC-type transport system involved in lysophospholipase L1 biosynthesis ATPase subunit